MKVLEYIEQRLEKTLTHVEHRDYGDNYDWYITNPVMYEKALPKLLEGVDLKGVSMSSLSTQVYLLLEMMPSDKITTQQCLQSFYVEEVEEQFSFEEIKEATGKRLTVERAKALGLKPGQHGYFYQYAPTDVAWCAVIDMEALLEFIEEEAA